MIINIWWYIKKHAIFELEVPNTVIKGMFSRSRSYYGNLLCHINVNNMFTNDLPVFWYHDCCIKW